MKIDRQSDGKATIIWLIGRIRAGDLPLIKQEIGDCSKPTVVDLSEVTIVDAAVVRFFSVCERSGIRLLSCPPYVREWIQREQDECGM